MCTWLQGVAGCAEEVSGKSALSSALRPNSLHARDHAQDDIGAALVNKPIPAVHPSAKQEIVILLP